MSQEEAITIGACLGGRYRLERELGKGGMGAVYLARDTLLSTSEAPVSVALKVILPTLHSDPIAKSKFINELNVARAVTHPNVIRTYDIHTEGETLFLTMEAVEGQSLVSRLKFEPFDPPLALAVLAQLAADLKAIHDAGVVHRDLKPANVLITPSGVAKIGDFGLALNTSKEQSKELDLIGSAPYMAPELWEGGDASKKSDVYAFGVLAYELLTGVPPFHANTLAEMTYQHLDVVPMRPIELADGIPQKIDEMIMLLLSKDPQARPSSATILREFEKTADLEDGSRLISEQLKISSTTTLGFDSAFDAPLFKTTPPSLDKALLDSSEQSPLHRADASEIVPTTSRPIKTSRFRNAVLGIVQAITGSILELGAFILCLLGVSYLGSTITLEISAARFMTANVVGILLHILGGVLVCIPVISYFWAKGEIRFARTQIIQIILAATLISFLTARASIGGFSQLSLRPAIQGELIVHALRNYDSVSSTGAALTGAALRSSPLTKSKPSGDGRELMFAISALVLWVIALFSLIDSDLSRAKRLMHACIPLLCTAISIFHPFTALHMALMSIVMWSLLGFSRRITSDARSA